jgi:hypothetical protein
MQDNTPFIIQKMAVDGRWYDFLLGFCAAEGSFSNRRDAVSKARLLSDSESDSFFRVIERTNGSILHDCIVWELGVI